MPGPPVELLDLFAGTWRAEEAWPLVLTASLCDLRTRFLAKGGVGSSCRAIARNGRVLLASPWPLGETAGRLARVRLQTWHRALLPGDPPRPHGILLCLHAPVRRETGPVPAVRIVPEVPPDARLGLDLGGLRFLVFEQPDAAAGPEYVPGRISAGPWHTVRAALAGPGSAPDRPRRR